MTNPTKLLFIETFLLGDLLYLGALLSAVRVQLPEAQIDVLASNATRGFPFFERLDVTLHHFDFPWSRIGWHRQPLRLMQAVVAVKKQFGRQFRDYLVLDPRGDLRHAFTAHLLQSCGFLAYRSGAGWWDAWRGASPRQIFTSRQEFLGQMAAECGLFPEAALPWPWLVNFEPGHQGESPKTVLLAPESSVTLRHWKPERWKLLSRRLRQNGWRVTLIIHRGDAVSDIALDDFDNVWRGSLPDLGRLVASSQAVISVDSFIGHLAAAMNIPVVSLFGTQLPERWRPWGEHTAVVMADGYPCRPCDLKNCVRPQDSCMDAIQVEYVFHTFQKLIDNQAQVPYENQTE